MGINGIAISIRTCVDYIRSHLPSVYMCRASQGHSLFQNNVAMVLLDSTTHITIICMSQHLTLSISSTLNQHNLNSTSLWPERENLLQMPPELPLLECSTLVTIRRISWKPWILEKGHFGTLSSSGRQVAIFTSIWPGKLEVDLERWVSLSPQYVTVVPIASAE